MKTKRIISLIFLFTLLCCTPASALGAQVVAPGDEIEVAHRYIEAMTAHDWETFLSLTVKRERTDYRQLIEDPASKENLIGLFNVTRMDVLTAVDFDLSNESTYRLLMGHSPLSTCVGVYDELRVLLLCVDMEVQKNVRPNFSGFEGRVMVLAREEGVWRVAMFSSADDTLLEAAIPPEQRGRGFQRHMERLMLRNKTGLWVGDDGKIFDDTSYRKSLKGFQDMSLAAYTPGQFTDVDENAWYGAEKQGAVKLAYQMRLMEGIGGDFAPEDTLTLGQAIKIACVVHSISRGETGAFTQSIPWYQVYVDYAQKNAMLPDGGFSDYNRAATRAEMVYIFANAIGEDALPEINIFDGLPDVSENDAYAESIFKLYRTGVLTGYEDGSFHPDAPVSRAEAAAIITRLAIMSERVFVYQTA